MPETTRLRLTTLRYAGLAAWFASALALTGCGSGDSDKRAASCVPGAIVSCACLANPALTTTCRADGLSYEPCTCGAPGTGAGAGGTTAAVGGGAGNGLAGTFAANAGTSGGAGSGNAGSAGFVGTAGNAGTSAGSGDSGSGGVAGTGVAGAAGTAAGSGGTGGDDDIEALRQLCVDEINRYRAMVSGLQPFKRGNATQETCSDTGAMNDGDTMEPHGYARMDTQGHFVTCRNVPMFGLLGAQDACPGWPVGSGFGAYPTVADALKDCLKSMWAEGPPPGSVASCTDQCYEDHGHYINMSDPNAASVSCSFYKMKDGKSWWMNQDFSTF